MFDDLKSMLEKADIPTTVRVALTVITKAVSWFPWVFVGIGLFLRGEYFLYWLVFFMVIEGVLLIALVYMLVLLVRYSMQVGETSQQNDQAKLPGSASKSTNGLVNMSLSGVVGNAAFYLVLFAAIVLLKVTGVVDSVLDAIFATK